jgi:hypothetical protein
VKRRCGWCYEKEVVENESTEKADIEAQTD